MAAPKAAGATPKSPERPVPNSHASLPRGALLAVYPPSTIFHTLQFP
jgi:hypothetical protein